MEGYGAMPPAMSTPGSRTLTIGLVIMLLSVSTGMHFDSYGLLLCFVGVLVGATFVAVGVRMAEGLTPIVSVAFGGARALVAFVRRDAASMGLFMASCAVTMLVSGEAHPLLYFATFALLLLGLTLVNVGAGGE